MNQQIVSFEIAKALKEAGYPQGLTTNMYLTKDTEYLSEGTLMDSFDAIAYVDYIADAPTYLDVWLWLWKTIGICIDIWINGNATNMVIWDEHNKPLLTDCKDFSDPEKAIGHAIHYLVKNNLIK